MSALPTAALALLDEWLPGDDDPDRPRVQLATVDADGGPDVRTVLLSSWDAHGFAFHTDSRSRKVAQLEVNPRAALTLLWPDLSRQLVVRGAVQPLTGTALADAYGFRSDYLKRLAWVNTAETASLTADERRAVWAASLAERPAAALAAPETWVGFRLVPMRVTVWQSDPDGPSHRVEYRLSDGGWTEHHLPG